MIDGNPILQSSSPSSSSSDLNNNNNNNNTTTTTTTIENTPQVTTLLDMGSDNNRTRGRTSSSLGMENHNDTNDHLDNNNNNNNDDEFWYGSTTGMTCRRRIVVKCIQLRTVADYLQSKSSRLRLVLMNGKWVAILFIGLYVGFLIGLWLPFYIVSYIIPESILYTSILLLLVIAGRCILRLLAFPAACTTKVVGEIENEFCNYSIRILSAAVTPIEEMTDRIQTIYQQQNPQVQSKQLKDTTFDYTTTTTTAQQQQRMDLPSLWYRCSNFRNRILAVYYEVLQYIYYGQQSSLSSSSSSSLVDETGASSSSSSLELTVTYDTNSTPTTSTTSNNETSTAASSTVINRFGNNRLSGDIGQCDELTSKAKNEGLELLQKLKTIIELMDELERSAPTGILEFKRSNNRSNFFTGSLSSSSLSSTAIPATWYQIAKQLHDATTNFKDFLTSLKPTTSNNDTTNDSEEDCNGHSSENDGNGSTAATSGGSSTKTKRQTVGEVIKSGFNSIGPTLDPPPHDSIFGLDVQRGCMISRYRGARQIWVNRPNNSGKIDVIHFPAVINNQTKRNTRAVLYCNPNAGLIEVTTGLSLTAGGNVPAADSSKNNNNTNRNTGAEENWVDIYTELGIDVYLFNYAGYGRSYGTTLFATKGGKGWGGDPKPGLLARLGRIARNLFCTFQPTSETLRSDAIAVAEYVIKSNRIEQLIIHGESIGGMAAAGAARHLSTSKHTLLLANPDHDLSFLLLCDRTFCNLEALAQRLVGSWSGYAIRGIAPFWNMDITNDFLSAQCPKIIASDANDMIIHDAASLKSGVALYTELYDPRRIQPKSDSIRSAITKRLGWVQEIPVVYRMAEYEDVYVTESKYYTNLQWSKPIIPQIAPTWPQDKHFTVEEAIHFAFCCKRISKHAKLAANSTRRRVSRRISRTTASEESEDDDCDEENGSHFNPLFNSNNSNKPLILQIWILLGCCDSLTGMTLGVATKHSGYDVISAWLCSCVIFGSQIVTMHAEHRISEAQQQHPNQQTSTAIKIEPIDYDQRPEGYDNHERSMKAIHPKPIPEVVDQVRQLIHNSNDDVVSNLQQELQYILGVLQYVVDRLSSTVSIQKAQTNRKLQHKNDDDVAVGCFLNLHCGHNNAYSTDERYHLEEVLNRFFNRTTTENENTLT